MELFGYLSNNKITTYKFKLNNKTFLFDYGSKVDNINAVDYVFLTHEHLDHYYGLIEQISEIDENIKIFSTKTTKLLIHELVKKNISLSNMKKNDKQKLLKMIFNINEVVFLESVNLDNDLSFCFYPSGHTYGSAMIYLMGDKKILYTGDMDYHSKDLERRYFFDFSNKVDYLICDGTKLLDDEKMETANLSKLKSGTLTFMVKPEKAVFLAHKFAQTSYFKDYEIYFEKDLKWFLGIIYKQGYNPFVKNKVMLINDDIKKKKEKKIILSSKNYEKFKRNNYLSLHIAKNDLLDFIYKANASEVLIGHYDILNEPIGFNLVKAGENII